MRIQKHDLDFAAFVTGLGAAYYAFMENRLPKDVLLVHGVAIGIFGASQIAFRGSLYMTEIPAAILLGASLSYQQTLSKASTLSLLLFTWILYFGAVQYHKSDVSNGALELNKKLFEGQKGARKEI